MTTRGKKLIALRRKPRIEANPSESQYVPRPSYQRSAKSRRWLAKETGIAPSVREAPPDLWDLESSTPRTTFVFFRS